MVRIDGTTILTWSGRYVNPLDLRPEDVSLDDIAHALSNQCRFSGHTSDFYSVANHSVLVCELLVERGCQADTCLWGLLHDASEAYLVDLPSPLKQSAELGVAYLRVEERAMLAVAEAFALPWPIPETVHEADLALLAAERRDLMPPQGEWAVIAGVTPWPPEQIVPWTPGVARHAFHVMYDDLRPGVTTVCYSSLLPLAERASPPPTPPPTPRPTPTPSPSVSSA